MAHQPTQPLSYHSPAPAAAPKTNRWRGGLGWVLFIGMAVMLFMLLSKRETRYAEVPLSDFTDHLEAGRVALMTVEGDEISGEFRSPEQVTGGQTALHFRTALPAGASGDWSFTQWLLANRNGADVRARATNSLLVNILLPLVPWILIFLFVWFFVFRQVRKGAAAGPTQVIVSGPGRWVPDEPQHPGAA